MVRLVTLDSNRLVFYLFHRSRKNPLSLLDVQQLPTFWRRVSNLSKTKILEGGRRWCACELVRNLQLSRCSYSILGLITLTLKSRKFAVLFHVENDRILELSFCHAHSCLFDTLCLSTIYRPQYQRAKKKEKEEALLKQQLEQQQHQE